MTVFIFAAGLGTRLYPWTLTHPKALFPVNGIPLLKRVIQNIDNQIDVRNWIINVHHFAHQIIDYIEHDAFLKTKNIIISDESDRLLDTGGGLLNVMDYQGLDNEILIHNVDILSDLDLNKMVYFHQKEKNDITLLVKERHSSRQLLIDEECKLKGWINTDSGETKPDIIPDINQLRHAAFGGIHILNRSVFNYLKEYGKIIGKDSFSVIPFYLWVMDKINVKGYFYPEFYNWIDVGKPDAINTANNIFK